MAALPQVAVPAERFVTRRSIPVLFRERQGEQTERCINAHGRADATRCCVRRGRLEIGHHCADAACAMHG